MASIKERMEKLQVSQNENWVGRVEKHTPQNSPSLKSIRSSLISEGDSAWKKKIAPKDFEKTRVTSLGTPSNIFEGEMVPKPKCRSDIPGIIILDGIANDKVDHVRLPSVTTTSAIIKPIMEQNPVKEPPRICVDSPKKVVREQEDRNIHEEESQSLSALRSRAKAPPKKRRPLIPTTNNDFVETPRAMVSVDTTNLKTSAIDSATLATIGKISLAPEAKAGLAAIEDFSKVSLTPTKFDNLDGTNDYPPYKFPMLFCIKGGRPHIHSILVPPELSSLNSGDCFVFLPSNDGPLWLWRGRDANVMEKSQSEEVCKFILRQRDLGIKASVTDFHIVDEEFPKWPAEFVQQLSVTNHSSSYYNEAENADADDAAFRKNVDNSYRVYLVDNGNLVPSPRMDGLALSFENLDHSRVFIFDFGNEVYVWHGKNASRIDKLHGDQLGKALFAEFPSSFDKDFVFNPCRGGNDNRRPAYAIFGRQLENLESILFRTKFASWNDRQTLAFVKVAVTSRGEHVITGQSNSRTSVANDAKESIDVKVASDFIASAIVGKPSPVNLRVGGVIPVGRGAGWRDDSDGIVRETRVLTESVRILEFDTNDTINFVTGWSCEGEGSEDGIRRDGVSFVDDCCYVVEWQFSTRLISVRTLDGKESGRGSKIAGQSHMCRFYWHGERCPPSKLGSCAWTLANDPSAIAKIEPAIHRLTSTGEVVPCAPIKISQNREPAAFLRIFGGKLIVLSSSRDTAERNFLVCRAADPHETVTREIVWQDGIVYPNEVARCKSSGGELIIHGEADVGHLQKLLGVKTIVSRRNPPDEYPRATQISHVFQFVACYGTNFECVELVSARKPDATCPFVQFAFSFEQCAKCSDSPLFFLFLADNGFSFVWNDITDEQAIKHPSTLLNLYRNAIRCLSEFCSGNQALFPSSKCYFVNESGSLIHKVFLALFPDPHNFPAESIRNLDSEETICLTDMTKRLAAVDKSRFPLERLTNHLSRCELPLGVDSSALERYLSDEDFDRVFGGISRNDFDVLPSWRQIELRKANQLF